MYVCNDAFINCEATVVAAVEATRAAVAAAMAAAAAAASVAAVAPAESKQFKSWGKRQVEPAASS